MVITMLHCYIVFYIIREHGLDFWCIRVPPPLVFEHANFECQRAAQTQRVLSPSDYTPAATKRPKVHMLSHPTNGNARPGNLKPSHVLASRVAGITRLSHQSRRNYLFRLSQK